ncbi:Outer membrane efflux protein [Caulifigura coniformis]|uniref:Outer membrane efflux protein n=2 Tax=Caulifigura coniformis TaxID=2527983 RepID=A0A517S7T2_9PLAN|nr:Outer membrane efflux protein [Caulifigura coniformis]
MDRGQDLALVTPRTAPAALAMRAAILLLLILCSLPAGCRNTNPAETVFNDTAEVDAVMARVDNPEAEPIVHEAVIQPVTLKTLKQGDQPDYWDVSLDEVLGIAMTNSQVLRDLGATILRAPGQVQTRYTRLIQQSDPRFGMEAALSAYDAQLFGSAMFQDNYHIANNLLLSGTDSLFSQDKHDYVAQLSKLTATGGQMSLRSLTDYDHNNVVSHLFPTAWQQQMEAELRQPLLQGGGLTFNRIAGPGAIPGVSNGVLIAKVNSDITAVDFERGLRDYVSDVVNAYWDLYFAYRDLDAKRLAVSRSRETWEAYKVQQDEGRESAAAEALAREQYFRFQSELQDAVAGKVGQRTQDQNGSTGGVFRGVNGVQVAERRLRLLVGLPVNDGRTLRPGNDPEIAPVEFHWESMVTESLRRRPEVRAQRLLVKRRELELIAAQNFLAPRLDAVGVARVRGLGHDLAGGGTDSGYGSALDELGTMKYREFAAGLEFSMPLGFRRAHAAVDNAEFLLARERAVLTEQERQILHDLSNTIADVDRAYEQVRTNENRYLAAEEALAGLEANRREGLTINLEQLLDIQRRLTESQSRYYQSRVEYAIALKNVHVEKGSILEYASMGMIDATTPEPVDLPAVPPVAPTPAAAPEASATAPDSPEAGSSDSTP